ncbi:zinc finger CCCH domain-containing protein 43 isoform X2 [Manihot esculenta]|uniref:C3H1-type domain-containing protein n=1 Tax=Manihot esculenta TaxID=3983 RepID=A0A2C9UK38_MANES|nr:zinc finger CCCH domain-containing protein 43 isoform X2 [Manihot esculenta]OAY30751.1 hypothetical protein MANES_14G055800v8 [Manihot esculenta]
MDYSEPSNFLTDTADTNPKFGFQSSLPSSNADPGSDQTLELRKELEKKQLYLKEGKGENEEAEPDMVVVEKVYEELEKQLHLKEVEEDNHSIEWNQNDDFNCGESHDGEEGLNKYDKEDDGNDDEKYDDEVEKRDERSNGNRRHHYPVRPEAEDCSYYMKTGTCKFGSNCKFNHPATKEKLKEREEAIERPGQTECKYYLRTGGCKYGKACRYNHSRAKTPVLPAKAAVFPVLDLNFLGLPIRPGEKECPYYMRNGSCKYGANCRFNHPDPTAAGGTDPPSGFGNGGTAALQSSPQSSVAPWSSPRGLSEAAPFMPMMFPPTQGVPSQSPEWNGYQAPIYPQERSMHPTSAFVMSNTATDTNVYVHQQQTPFDEFPERPGQPECSYYLKTGDCKFRSNCKYHHPKNQIPKSSPCPLSDKGLPLRPGQHICSYYSRYGICKFGPACKFDHPIHPAAMTGSAEDQAHQDLAREESRISETGNETDTAIQQAV